MHAEVILFFPVNDNLINQSRDMHYTRYEQCMKRVSPVAPQCATVAVLRRRPSRALARPAAG